MRRFWKRAQLIQFLRLNHHNLYTMKCQRTYDGKQLWKKHNQSLVPCPHLPRCSFRAHSFWPCNVSPDLQTVCFTNGLTVWNSVLLSKGLRHSLGGTGGQFLSRINLTGGFPRACCCQAPAVLPHIIYERCEISSWPFSRKKSASPLVNSRILSDLYKFGISGPSLWIHLKYWLVLLDFVRIFLIFFHSWVSVKPFWTFAWIQFHHQVSSQGRNGVIGLVASTKVVS